MNANLRDLYQEIILDHSRSPRNAGTLEAPDWQAKGNNPLCGDRISVYVKLEGDRISDVKFDARGCAITVASASMMTEMMKGKTIEEAEAAHQRFSELLSLSDSPALAEEDQMTALMGVREFPPRIKCATLPWQTLSAALDGSDMDATTE